MLCESELMKSRNVNDAFTFFECTEDIVLGDTCADGHQLRPHVVWFGEAVPMMDHAMSICETADILVIIGTSMQVYPAASLMHYVPDGIPVYFIDPYPSITQKGHLTVIAEPATVGMKMLLDLLKP